MMKPHCGNWKHGGCYLPEYAVWQAMIQRCRNKNCESYKDYGARGIEVCQRWLGRRPSDSHSIEREENDGNYEPGNCRWATRREQNRNNRQNVLLAFNGEVKCLSDWAKSCGLECRSLHTRIFTLGWSIERALTTPRKPRKGCYETSQ